MSPSDPADAPWPELRRVRRAVVFVDVVESVRLMRQHADDVIDRWRRFVIEVRTQVLSPTSGGRMVKHLGDGMLLEFDTVVQATAAALDIQRRIQAYNQGRAEDATLRLRIGAHLADVVQDDLDIYGHGVNLAARLTTVADPGEFVLSADARDALVAGLDVEIEDLGDQYLKHIDEPVRAYRVGPVGVPLTSLPAHGLDSAEMAATIAVIPFTDRAMQAHDAVIGELLADELIAGLSRLHQLRVISRLSTTAYRDRQFTLDDAASRLHARYFVTGAYVRLGADRIRLSMQMSDARSAHVVWADDTSFSVKQVLMGDSPAIAQAIGAIGTAIAQHELQRASTLPLPSLDSCALLMGAIALMHRATRRDSDRARAMLEVLTDRHRRHAQAHAWLGKWHVLRAVQGWTDDRVKETEQAMASARRALDADPGCSLALAVEGLIHAYLRKDMAEAGQCYALALNHNPSEALAWLFTSTLHSYQGEGRLAAQAAERALGLSPLDPMKYFFDSLAATAVLSSGNYARSIELAQRSLRANRSHTSTYRTLAIAQVLGGMVEQGRQTVDTLRMFEPELTVRAFIQRYPGTLDSQVREYAGALRQAGLPA